jgi:hypothetical protein
VWDALFNYGRLEWHRTLTDLGKIPNVAFEGILKELNNIVWCVKDIIVIHNN